MLRRPGPAPIPPRLRRTDQCGGYREPDPHLRSLIPGEWRWSAVAQLADAAVSEAPSVAALLATAVEALGGTEREGQERMAAAVERALRTGEHLAVQAGTGTGKSLPYLVPAIP